jgi:hypothetical protein
MRRLEAALRRARPQHLPGLHRIGQPPDRQAPEVPVLEDAADKPPRALRNNHLTRFRKCLQPRRQIGCLPNHVLLLCGAFADQVADDDDAGGNGDANLKRDIMTGAQRSDRFDKRQGAAHSPLGIVFMGLGIAEVGEHAVTHVLGDEATALGDLVVATSMVGADDPPHVLRIMLRGQRCRAHQIAEHHRELPTFCSVRAGLLRCGRRAGQRSSIFFVRIPRAESCDRIEHLSAVPDGRDAEVLQVLCGQAWEDRTVDLVLAECSLILCKAQAPQPARDIHLWLPQRVGPHSATLAQATCHRPCRERASEGRYCFRAAVATVIPEGPTPWIWTIVSRLSVQAK